MILLSPGCGNTSGLHDAQASDLASHGYVVVGIDHPGDTTAVDAGGGQILTMNPAAERIQDKSAVQRVADVHYVLHHLGAAVHGAGRLDRRRIGACGYSMGARATASAMYYKPSIRAGVNLDGLAGEPVLSHGLDQPYVIGAGVHAEDGWATPSTRSWPGCAAISAGRTRCGSSPPPSTPGSPTTSGSCPSSGCPPRVRSSAR